MLERPLIAAVAGSYPHTLVLKPHYRTAPPGADRTSPAGWKARAGSTLLRAQKKLWRLAVKRCLEKSGAATLLPSSVEIEEIAFHEISAAPGLERMKRFAPDVLITLRAPLLKPDALRIPSLAALNFHSGVAPAYRGNDCLFWAHYEGDFENLGATIHYLDPGIDTGNLLAVVRPALSPRDTEASILVKGVIASRKPLLEILSRLAAGSRPDGREQAERGRLFLSRRRTGAVNLRYLGKLATGRIRPTARPARIERYYL